MRLLRLQIRDDCFAGERALPFRNKQSGWRQIKIDAAAEANDAKALTSCDNVAGLDIRDDAARNEARDENDAQPRRILGFYHNVLAFIL